MWEMEVDAALIRRMENMSDMLDRLGLARAACSGRDSAPVFGSAVRVCKSCAAGDVCHDWPARAANTLYRAPEFCPNADRFAQLLAIEVQPNSLAIWAIKTGRKSAMPRAEQYLQHAIEAERARDRDAKEGLLEIARQWRELAERGEPSELEPTGSLSAD